MSSAATSSMSRTPTPPAARRLREGRRLRRWSTRNSHLVLIAFLRLAVAAAIIASWQIFTDSGWVDKTFSGQPSKIWSELVTLLGGSEIYHQVGTTLYEVFIGFVVAAAMGVAGGVLLRELPLVKSVAQPFLTAINSVPRIALAPLFVLWFGLGSESKIALSVSLVFFIVIANTMAGLQTADREHLLLARTLGAGRWREFRHYVLPGAIPSIFAGLELGMIYSFLAVVAGEMLGGTEGLGAQIQGDIASFRVNKFFAELLILVIISIAVSLVLRALERRLLKWRYVAMEGIEHA